MIITCPKCHFSKAVDPLKIPDRAVRVNCPQCGEDFSFDKSHHSDNCMPNNEESTRPEQISCPACGLTQPAEDRCRGCGLIYKKFQAIQKDFSGDQGDETLQGALADMHHKAAVTPALQPKAGFWIRVVAYLLDFLLLWTVEFVLSMLIGMTVNLLGLPTDGNPSVDVVIWMFGATLSLAYAVFFVGYCGQTPGKMALRIKVIRTDGSAVSYGRAVLREVIGKFISGILLGIGYLMVAFDSQKQGLHDKMADTYVIKL
ncbi:MAG: RDD family protein [Desulfuromonadales bacterium]